MRCFRHPELVNSKKIGSSPVNLLHGKAQIRVDDQNYDLAAAGKEIIYQNLGLSGRFGILQNN